MRTIGSNVKVTSDSTGGFVSVDWTCPECGEYNAGFYFDSSISPDKGDFEIDKQCERCGKLITIECCNSDELF